MFQFDRQDVSWRHIVDVYEDLDVKTQDKDVERVKLFVALAKKLVCMDGVKFLFSEKFSQDPLEEHFGCQRRRGGSSDNLTLLEFGNQ